MMHKTSNKRLALAVILGLLLGDAQAAAPLTDNKVIQSVMRKLIKNKTYSKTEITAIMQKTRRLPEVVERMKKPAESLPWHRYEQIFMKPDRIEQGAQFFKQHREALERAEKQFGVEKEIIVAIIGVETKYGSSRGGYRVIDALATLAADYPRRSAFFTKELEKFLLLVKKENIDPLEAEGSYAGAIGYPQFMPSSYLAYAVDFDGDGKRDLINSPTDAIGSVANYLRRHGWKINQPVIIEASVTGKRYRNLLKRNLKPVTSISQYRKYGVNTKAGIEQSSKTALFELDNPDSMEYWLAFTNFYAITRYNTSKLYAMAVYQLSQAVRQAVSNTK